MVTMRKMDGWSRRVHCESVMRAGVHFVEFRADVLTKDVAIGISRSHSTNWRFVGFDENSYSLSSNGRLQHESDSDFMDPFRRVWKAQRYSAGDTIGMLLDLNQLTLSYFKNGKVLGKAFDIEKVTD